MAARFELGAVVRLKSGGPAMTVVSTSSAHRTVTAWMQVDGTLHRDEFANAALMAVSGLDHHSEPKD